MADALFGGVFGLATFTFITAFTARKQAFGPEVPPLAGLRGKNIGGKRIPPGEPAGLPQNGAGRSGARPGAPTPEPARSWAKIGIARPLKKRSAPYGFPRNALPSRPEMN